MINCWHTNEVVDEMNKAYRFHSSMLLQTPHIQVLRNLIATATKRYGEKLNVLDLGCGTGIVGKFLGEHEYTGCDLPHIIEGCARVNNSHQNYQYCDWRTSSPSFLRYYDMVLANAFIDVMENPLVELEKLLKNGPKAIILHRQEISQHQPTTTTVNGSYNAQTWHSIINRNDFNKLLVKYNYGIMDQGNNEFENWENGGHSFLLEKQPTWAIHKIDHALVKLFKGKKNGIYIEAGANDGLTQSNTMLLHTHYDWHGILIEPVPEVFAKLKHNRPTDVCVHGALVEENYGHEKCVIEYTPECHGLMSSLKGMPFTAERLEKAGETGIGVWAPAITLNQVLEKSIVPKFDLMVLDIEGYEFKALHGIDFDKHLPIQYLMIEQLDKSKTDIEEYLKPWYDRVDLFGENDVVYKRKEA